MRRLYPALALLLLLLDSRPGVTQCTDWESYGEAPALFPTADVVHWNDRLITINQEGALVMQTIGDEGSLAAEEELSLPFAPTHLILSGDHLIAGAYEHAAVVELAEGQLSLRETFGFPETWIESGVVLGQDVVLSGISWTEINWTEVAWVFRNGSLLGSWSSFCHRGGLLQNYGDHVLSLNRFCGLQVLELSDPLDPLVLASLDLEYASGMEVQGHLLSYVGADGNVAGVVDLSDILDPVLLDEIPVPWGGQWDVSYFYELAWVGKQLLVAHQWGGLLSLHLSDDASLALCDTLMNADIPMQGICRSRDHLWFLQGGELLQLPIVNPSVDLEVDISLQAHEVHLAWPDAGPAEYTVLRSADAEFHGGVDTLGTTTAHSWTDEEALHAARAFYRVLARAPGVTR